MVTTVSEVIDLMDIIAPRWLGCENDPNGLHAGDPQKTVRKILLALDATMPVIQEAKTEKIDLVITHHPRFYRPLKNLDESTFPGKLAAEIARAKIALYCAHTNLDVAPGGVNDTLATLAGITEGECKPIQIVAEDRLLKLVVFVPDSHLESVREAVCEAGAGCLGNYDACSFRTQGTGTFRGSAESSPYLGTAGNFEEVSEWRLEVQLTASIRPAVIRAMLAAHPYEKVAYDIYHLSGGESYGLGRVGSLKKSSSLSRLAKQMKRKTHSPGTLVLGDPQDVVKKIGVWSGAACPVQRAIALGIDCLITGEIGYHDCEVLAHANVACIMLGHAPCEEIILPHLKNNLSVALPDLHVEIATSPMPTMWSV